MKYIKQIEETQHLKTFVTQELKQLGIKLPKKKSRTRNDSLELNRQIFGNHLCLLPQVEVLHCGPVPKFLYEASVILEKHADTEGLFRKSGSVARQKELKQSIEDGQSIANDANPLDLASLVKQFFRELPDPLLTSRHHDNFLKAFHLDEESTRHAAILLLCLLLPWHHLSTLRFIMLFLRKISGHAEQNKMDVQNLAVCLAPNILHANSKSDKMNTTESKLLQIQTSIVQLLINNADRIGMVADSLVEQCHLMSACFPEEDDLDAVGDMMAAPHIHNDSKSSKKAKKKRSGSFQGLMSNLSTSFSKWRKESRHNASSVSERSTYSYMSHAGGGVADKSSILMAHSDPVLHQLGGGEGGPDMTPKMLRKRKADDECVPFSASKKQAILQTMPHMSTLGGTPFTPAMRRGARGHPELVRTPSIQFTSGAEANAVFSATPGQRKSPGKAGCFSPKTPKNGVRKTVRGFLKRLSGGKEVQNALSACEGGGERDYVPLVELSAARRKSGSVFRKHRKTPSSPARLVTPLLQQGRARRGPHVSAAAAAATSDEYTPLSDDSAENQHLEHEFEAEADATPLTSRAQHRRRYSEGLRRGKPNTIKTGLPSPAKRRSTDTAAIAARFVSPDKNKPMGAVPSTLDTSPILKAGQDEASPITMVTSRMEVTDLDHSAEVTPPHHRRQVSSASLTSIATLGDQTHIESEMDRAFIHESMLMDSPEIEDISGSHMRSCGSLYTSTTNNTPEGSGSAVFKKPLSTAGSMVAIDTERAPVLQQKIMSRLNQSCASDASSEASACTVIHNGQPVVKCTQNPTAVHHQSSRAETRCLVQETTRSRCTHRTESVDSAIDMCGSEAMSESERMRKCASLQSVHSVDSGVSLGADKTGSGLCMNLKERSSRESIDIDALGSDNNSTEATSKQTSHETSVCNDEEESFVFQRTPSIRISNKMHDMLSKVSAVSDSASNSHTNALHTEQLQQSDTHSAAEGGRESTEIAERRASPFRFHNSHLRRRMGSPVRIPTIFAKADSDHAAKYRECVAQNAALRTSPKPNAHAKKPNLPIDMVNVPNVLKARAVQSLRNQRGESPEFNDPSAGSTPSRLLHKLKYNTVDFNTSESDACQDNIENTRAAITNMAATPKIKEGLLPSKRLLSKQTVSDTSDTCKSVTRTPVKPLKRLQGPSPVARYSRSPKKVAHYSKDRSK